jgi:hypothetical protein
VLDEVRADFAVMYRAAERAEGVSGAGQHRRVARLYDEAVEEAQAALEGTRVRPPPVFVGERRREVRGGGDGFEVDGRHVARRLRLVVADEGAGLLLLIGEQPVNYFKRELGEARVARHAPPAREGLRVPRDLPEAAPVSEAVAVVGEGAFEFLNVNPADVRLRRGGERE